MRMVVMRMRILKNDTDNDNGNRIKNTDNSIHKFIQKKNNNSTHQQPTAAALRWPEKTQRSP